MRVAGVVHYFRVISPTSRRIWNSQATIQNLHSDTDIDVMF